MASVKISDEHLTIEITSEHETMRNLLAIAEDAMKRRVEEGGWGQGEPFSPPKPSMKIYG